MVRERATRRMERFHFEIEQAIRKGMESPLSPMKKKGSC
jgi:hypothetical protein